MDFFCEGGKKGVSHGKGLRGVKGPVAMGGSVGDPIAGSRFIGGEINQKIWGRGSFRVDSWGFAQWIWLCKKH